MEKVTVIITGVGGRAVGYQVLSCLKHFPERYTIIACDADAFSAGMYEADRAYLLPFASDPTYLDALLTIAKRENAQVVIPGSQQEVSVLAENEALLREEGLIAIVNPAPLVAMVADKISQYILLQAYGFSVPRFLPVTSLPHKVPFAFPLIAKPSKDHQGSRNVYIVKDYKELQEMFELTKRTNTAMLLQEYVGDPTQEYTVGVVVDSEGVAVDAIVMRRVLHGLSLLTERTIDGQTYAISSGYSQGVIVKDEAVRVYCMAVAEAIGARGPLNIQLRKTDLGIKIFEIHTRFSGSASQRAAVGFNEPDLLIRNFVFGEKITPPKYQTDVAIIRRFENVVVPFAHVQQVANNGEYHADLLTKPLRNGNAAGAEPSAIQASTRKRPKAKQTGKVS